MTGGVALHVIAMNSLVAEVMGLGCREPGWGDPAVDSGCSGIMAGGMWLPQLCGYFCTAG